MPTDLHGFLAENWDKVLLTVFTGLLAWFTFRLWRSTENLWLSTKASVEALPKMERAYVFVEIKLEEPLIHTPSGNAQSKISLYIWNHGRTPAALTKIRGYCVIVEELPQELLKFPGSENELPTGLVIAGGGYRVEHATCHISNVDMGDIEGGQRVLYCIGKIEYEDVMGVHRETGFCWQYRPSSSMRDFVISPNTKLNYRT
jgi:hypothetical protein